MPLPREKLTEKLGRIADAAARPDLPFDVHGIYVFGSYSRGALECGDLDIIVHADLARLQKLQSEWRKENGIPPWDHSSRRGPYQQDVAVRRELGARWGLCEIDVVIAWSNGMLKWYTDHWAPRLVWSPAQPDWKANLETIEPDASAGRFQRDHFVSVKRTGSALGGMEHVMKLLERREIVLETTPLDTVVGPLPPWATKKLARLREDHKGKTLRLIPYVLRWFVTEGCGHCTRDAGGRRALTEWQSVPWNVGDPRRAAHLGRIDLYWMLRQLSQWPTTRVCLIPHFTRDGPNAQYVFSRGPEWDDERQA